MHTLNSVAPKMTERTSVPLKAKLSSTSSLIQKRNICYRLTKLIECDACSVLRIRVFPALGGIAEMFPGKENISPTNLDQIKSFGGIQRL